MSDIVQNIKNGKVVTSGNSSSTSTDKTSSSNELGKDAFLKLLVTQMKYQDPLNPSTDTQYVSQLATFSQLEQLQNLSTAATNSQAFGLVGKDVIIKSETDGSDTQYITGKVDFVNLSGTKTQLSVNGNLYSIDDLDSVLGSDYVTEKNQPGITSKVALKYDADNAKNLSFAVNLGSGDLVASQVAVVINNTKVDSSLVSLKGNTVTIDKSAVSGLTDGTYNVSVVFNDSNYTTVSDKVTLQVSNSKVTADSTDSTDTTTN